MHPATIMNSRDVLKTLAESDRLLSANEIIDEFVRVMQYNVFRSFFCGIRIYTTLMALEEQGFIRGQFVEGLYPRRRVYSLTDSGLARYNQREELKR